MRKSAPALVIPLILLALLCVCAGPDAGGNKESPAAADYAAQRQAMVKHQIQARAVKDPRVLAAMRKVPRHEFVPAEQKANAYSDRPLPIGYDQTISQPYIVAFMSEALRIGPGARVLEIGTGSGYQAAVLTEMGAEVYSIEIVCPLAEQARKDLDRIGYSRVVTKCGDGYQGWPEPAPFDAVIVTAAPDHVPAPLLDQLKPGGRLVIPVGTGYQQLKRFTKTDKGMKEEDLLPVVFVPMTGEAEKKQ
jgi:protein-L-isoaspartate(D-aspartate) O-methyltransferase